MQYPERVPSSGVHIGLTHQDGAVGKMGVSPEEFFMYLTIGLIVIAPIAARIYRRMTLQRTQKMLRAQFETNAGRQGEQR